MNQEQQEFLDELDERLEILKEVADGLDTFYREDRIEEIAADIAGHLAWDLAHTAAENIIHHFTERLDTLFQNHDLDIGDKLDDLQGEMQRQIDDSQQAVGEMTSMAKGIRKAVRDKNAAHKPTLGERVKRTLKISA